MGVLGKLAILLFPLILITTCGGDLTYFKLTVLDDTGNPVEGAKVGASFLLSHGSGGSTSYTNSKGKFWAFNKQRWGVSFSVDKDGYHRSSKRVNKDFSNVEIILRPIKNPAKLSGGPPIAYSFQKQNKAVAFDFVARDWLPPHGQGQSPHMWFKFTGNRTDYFNYEGELEFWFENKFDGLIQIPAKDMSPQSKYKYPYLVKGDEFGSEFKYRRKRERHIHQHYIERTNETNQEESLIGYYLRFNSKVDIDGNLISANYGYFGGDIGYGPLDEPESWYLRFSYAFNPIPNDRNIEIVFINRDAAYYRARDSRL